MVQGVGGGGGQKLHLAEGGFVVQSRAAVSMSASSNFKIEGTIDPGGGRKKEKDRNCVITLIGHIRFDRFVQDTAGGV